MFHYKGGLVEYIQYLNKENAKLHPEPIAVTREVDGMLVEVAMQWSADSYSETLLGYANWCATCFPALTRCPRPSRLHFHRFDANAQLL